MDDHIAEAHTPDESASPAGESGESVTPVDVERRAAVGGVQHTLEDPDVARRRTGKLSELASRRERGKEKLSPYDLDLNVVFGLNAAGIPLMRKTMQHETGMQALVLTRDIFEQLGSLMLTLPSGAVITIQPESLHPDDVLIIYPEDLGDEK